MTDGVCGTTQKVVVLVHELWQLWWTKNSFTAAVTGRILMICCGLRLHYPEQTYVHGHYVPYEKVKTYLIVTIHQPHGYDGFKMIDIIHGQSFNGWMAHLSKISAGLMHLIIWITDDLHYDLDQLSATTFWRTTDRSQPLHHLECRQSCSSHHQMAQCFQSLQSWLYQLPISPVSGSNGSAMVWLNKRVLTLSFLWSCNDQLLLGHNDVVKTSYKQLRVFSCLSSPGRRRS